jgi:putative hydroxymethylpyrimidine transport system substrate-binding protein
VRRLLGETAVCASLLALLAFALSGCGGGSEAANTVAAQEQTTGTAEEEAAAPKGETTVAEVFKNAGPLRCPSRSEEISVSLDADPHGANAALMMALKRGYFTDAGLDVFVGGPKNPARAVHYVSAGIDDIGVGQLPQVLLSREEGGPPLVAFGSIIHQSNTALIWLPESGIADIADLEGKTIGIPGVPFQEGFLEEVLAGAGLTLEDVTVKRTNYQSTAALLEGRVDAVFGATWNVVGAELESREAEPVIKRAQDLGLPEYEELVVVAPAKCVAKNPGIIRDFMAAVARGTQAAKNDPVEAANFAAQSYRLDPRFRMRDLRAQFAASVPLLSEDAHMDLAQAGQLATWMREKGMLEQMPAIAEMFTNDYLPKP